MVFTAPQQRRRVSVLSLRSANHARIEFSLNGFRKGLGLKIFVHNISPGSFDGILLYILFCDEVVLEPFLCPISSNPLDLILATCVGFLRTVLYSLCKSGGKSLEVFPWRCLPPFLADFSVAMKLNLKGFSTCNGFRRLVRQELAPGELM